MKRCSMTLTNTPMPTWFNLVRALLFQPRSDADLASYWCREGELAGWLSRSAWSLALIAQWRQSQTPLSPVTVWIPDYFCNASLAALRKTGVKLIFYPVTYEMSPDYAACKGLAEAEPPDLFVLVHYFGRPTSAAAARDFCTGYGAWLIEDAAHVLYPGNGVGDYGDFVLYSPHKHLPIPDGALLVVRKNGPAGLAEEPCAEKSFQNVLHSFFNVPGFSCLPAVRWLFKRILQMIGVRRRKHAIPFFFDDDATMHELEHPRMSPIAKRILSGLIESLDTVATLRKQNKQQWDRTLAKAVNLRQPAIRPENNDSVPYLADFIFDDETQAEKAYLQLQKMALPVMTWPDLPPEVTGEPVSHRIALKFRRTCLYLPVHQTITPRQIRECTSEMF